MLSVINYCIIMCFLMNIHTKNILVVYCVYTISYLLFNFNYYFTDTYVIIN